MGFGLTGSVGDSGDLQLETIIRNIVGRTTNILAGMAFSEVSGVILLLFLKSSRNVVNPLQVCDRWILSPLEEALSVSGYVLVALRG